MSSNEIVAPGSISSLVLQPNSDRVWITHTLLIVLGGENSMVNGKNGITVYDLATNTIVGELENSRSTLLFEPEGQIAYAAHGTGSICAIDPMTMEII